MGGEGRGEGRGRGGQRGGRRGGGGEGEGRGKGWGWWGSMDVGTIFGLILTRTSALLHNIFTPPTASTCQRGFFILRILLACPSWSGSRENHSMLPRLLGYALYSSYRFVSPKCPQIHGVCSLCSQYYDVDIFCNAARMLCCVRIRILRVQIIKCEQNGLNFSASATSFLFCCAYSNFRTPNIARTCFSASSVSSCPSQLCSPFSTLLECL